MHKYLALVSIAFLVGCQPKTEAPAIEEPTAAVEEVPVQASLADILDAQPEAVKARYQFRNPKETIEFFGIEPGMTVLEGLPGRGWYTQILLPYIGPEGCVIGAAYSLEMYKLFPFATDDFMAKQSGWQEQFVIDAKEWGGDASPHIEAFHFASMPEKLANTADVAFFPRVLHNPANFQNAGVSNYLEQVLGDIHTVLKPGGILGVVQHEARPDMSDEFADGSHGYLKKAWLIEQIEAAGFEFVAESAINENEKDQPSEDDIVWRLPPSYVGTRDDADMKAAVDAIGESNRMTLKFRKPK